MRAMTTAARRPQPGDATIIEALAILERRLRKPGAALASPGQIKAYLMLHLAEQDREVFVAMFLDNQHRLIEARDLFHGTLTQTSVYPREVVRAALAANAASVVFAHNHPSGIAEQSHADEMLTRTLKQALALVDIRVLDHFIVAGSVPPISFAERGLL
jgi:DNA repair protein RadC